MLITILSDIHLDFYFKSNVTTERGIRRVFDNYLDPNPDVEVLIVAGDISHYNSQFGLVELMAELYNYKRVFMVLGNHDRLLLNPSMSKKYDHDSRVRIADWYTRQTETVRILDGVVEEYKGVKFGGTSAWYDGTYNAPIAYAYRDPVELWKHLMIDGKYTKKMGDFYDMYAEEKSKISRILDADVVITHFNPLAQAKAFQLKYRDELSSMFYAFDGEEFLRETTAQYWVFGHSHGYHTYTAHGTQCLMNAMGYPNEIRDLKRCTIGVHPRG